MNTSDRNTGRRILPLRNREEPIRPPRNRGWRILSIGCAVAAATGTPPAAAQSQDEAGARALFLDGRKLEKAGHYEEACSKFEAARKLYTSSGVLLNLADCHEHLNRTASAWAEFGDAAIAAAGAGRVADEAEAKRRQSLLEGRLTRLAIRVNGATADEIVRRDTVPVDRAAWTVASPVDPGSHVVSAEASGRLPWSVTIDVDEPGETVTFDVPALAKLPPPDSRVAGAGPAASAGFGAGALAGTAQSDEARPQAHPLGTQRALALVSAGVGLVGVGIGTVFGLESLSKHSQASGLCPGSQMSCSDPGVTLWREAVVAGDRSTVAFIVGGVGLAGGVVLWVTAKNATSTSAGVQVGLEWGSVHLRGAW
jgi:hypothetical protein